MKSVTMLIQTIACLFQILCLVQANKRVAVIGSGISGASSTRHLRQLLGPDVDIIVYEKSDRVGGRMRIDTIEGVPGIEIGASILHNSNEYMVSFTKEAGLTKGPPAYLDAETGPGMAIFDGRNIVFQSYPSELRTLASLIWRYGLAPIWMRFEVDEVVDKFVASYEHLRQGHYFPTVEDFLSHIDASHLVNQTIDDALTQLGISQNLIDELVAGIMRVNYGQTTNMNAFAGFVSLAGSSEDLWAVKEGNVKICEYLIETHSTDLFLNTQVKTIEKQSTGTFKLTIISSDGKESQHDFDAVVMANHFTASDIELSSIHLPSDWIGQHTHASFIVGVPRPKTFGLEEQDFESLPLMFLTTESHRNFFSSLGIVAQLNVTDHVGHKTSFPGYGLYKVFSRNPLTKSDINRLFEYGKIKRLNRHGMPTESYSPEIELDVDWEAYPQLPACPKFAPFRVTKGFYYPNAIEATASAMEMLAIAGHNIALMAAEDLGQN